MVKQNSKLALDIGSYAVKGMEVSFARKAPVIENIGVYEVADSSQQGLVKALKALLETSRISARDVSIAVSGSAVVVRFIELPLMHDSEVSQALPYEAEKCLPFDVKDVILDYKVLEKDTAEKKMKLLLVGAKRDFIDKRLEVLKAAGLEPSIIDVDSFAIFNAFINGISAQERGEKTIVLLNIGSNLTNVIIASGDNPWMVRDINVGGANMTQAIQEHLGVDKVKAQTLKHNPSERDEKVMTALKTALQRLTDEIKLSFTYYEDQYGKGVDELYLSGGSIAFEEAVSALKESTGMEFKLWDPLKPFEISPNISQETVKKFSSSLAVCSGLALRS